jgi:hypothetical protein
MPRGVYVRRKLKRRKKKPAKYVPPLSPAYRKTPWVSVSVRAEHYTMLRELGEFYEKPMTSVIATLIATQFVKVLETVDADQAGQLRRELKSEKYSKDIIDLDVAG